MFSEYEVKKQICEIGKRMYNSGFVAANDGNITVKINDKEILATPTGISKGFMTPDMICKVDMDGKVLAANGKYRPSSEIKMHIRVYKERADVNSVVHAHPPYATSFAIAGIPLTKPIMPEAVIALGCVPIAEYGTPSTEEIPDAVSKYLQHYDAVLLENHGALSYGADLTTAYHKMESLEFYAKLLCISTQLGGPKELSGAQVERLYELRKQFGLAGRHPAEICNEIGGEQCTTGCNAVASEAGSNRSVAAPQVQDSDVAKVVAEVTKRVIEQMGMQ
ncbi:L-fuculose-phosphate aldolase [Natronincola peptidivorans]|uniref:L-fuculose-phosphate aldolase n=1 Tax=Natronincola peptidivorans TaxID=426128 RepID=A0A1I0CGE6_9FIRM|nr:class II aldolase/adducin family protein [Natronincola peptidivorans]SET18578.1 L-fuculose-phosphate aldolase [Natronincola peptidivorans]